MDFNLQTAKSSEAVDASIKTVSAYLSLENCESFIEKQNHQDRIAKVN